MMNGTFFRALLLVFVALVTSAAGYWAGKTFGREVGNAAEQKPELVTTKARTGTLEEVYAVPINLEWTQDLSLPFLGDPGVVTALNSEPGRFFSTTSGSVIGTVDGQPIVVIEGGHPAYRLMELGVAGPDVAQLQDHLVSTGHLAANNADGTFGPPTAQAVQEWWETLGVDGRDTVPVGSVTFASDLPRLLSTDPTVRVGELISNGAPFLVGVPSTPVATVTLTEIQDQRFRTEGATFTARDPSGTEVEMTVLGTRIRDRATEIELELASGQFDDWSGLTLSARDPVRLNGRMVVTPPIKGTILPSAALNDHVGFSATLRFADGTPKEVTVLAVVGGLAIVEPLVPGTEVVVGQ